jgi:hypothetical protein
VPLLEWLYRLDLFSNVTIERMMENHVADNLQQSIVFFSSDNSKSLDKIMVLCSKALETDEFVKSIKEHCVQLQQTQKMVLADLAKVMLMYDPRPGKLEAVVLFEKLVLLLETLDKYRQGKFVPEASQ